MSAPTERHVNSQDEGTIVIVGAGPGVGAAVAERFARAGYAVGLIARNQDRLTMLAEGLAGRTRGRFATATADGTVPGQVRRAVQSVTVELGAPSVLCFSPIPDIALIKPVLKTRPEDFMASLQLNIGGASEAVGTVVPDMLARGRGSLLFTTGSAALHPDPARAASAVTTSAAAGYISLLREALAGTGVRVGYTVIAGPIDRDDPHAHHPDAIAADLWSHHRGQADGFPSVLRLA